MARLFTSGFELGSVATGVEISGVTGTTSSISTDSGYVRTGTYSNKILTSNSYANSQYRYAASGAGKGVVFIRAYVKFSSLPASGNCTLLSLMDTAGGLLGGIYMNGTDKKLGILYYVSTTATYATAVTSALVTGQWYKLELKVDVSSANSQIVTAKLDGVQFDTRTGSATTIANAACSSAWGMFFAASDSAGTGTCYFDDIAINDNSGSYQNSYPGSGSVISLRPAGAGESTGWARAGTNSGANWSQCNNTPPNDVTSYVQATTLNALDMYTVTSSGLNSTHIINVVEVGGRMNRSASQSPTMAFRLIKQSGGTQVLSSNIQPSATAWITNANAAPFTSPIITYVDPDGSAWTSTTLGTMQIGVKETVDTSRYIQVSEVWSKVEYTIAEAPSVSTSACSSVSTTSATGNGEIIDTGGATVTRRGFCYMLGTSGDPTTANSVSYDDGSFTAGVYTKSITGLSSGTNYRVRAYAVNSAGTGYGTTVQLTTTNASPTVSLNSPSNTSSTTDTTPTFNFTGSDGENNDIQYHIQIDTVDTFNSGNLISKVSGTDAGFAGSPDNTSPYTAGQAVEYTVQTPLSGGTYYWRVRGIDPSGSNTYGSYSSTWSLTVNEPFAISGTSDLSSGTVSVAVNNALQGQTGTISGGNWYISGVTTPSSGDTIIVFVSDAASADVSTAVTTYSGSGAIGGMVLNRHVLSIGSSQNRSLTLADLVDYDYDQDTSHILFSTNGSPATLQMDPGSLYSDEKISILSGNTLTLGSGEILNAYDVLIGGTLASSGGSTFNVTHDWTNNGTFTASTSTVNLSGTTKQTLSGTLNSASAFYDLTITNNSGASPSDNERTGFTPSVDFNAAAKVTNNYTITTANTRVEYESGATYEFQNINWNGQSTSSRIVFRNSATSGTWLLKVTGGQTSVTCVDVSRSDASVSGGSSIFAGGGTNDDSTNNTNWIFNNTRMRQEVNIVNATYSSSGDSNEIVYIDPSKYSGTLSYRFEIVAMVSSGTGTVTLHDAANNIHATVSVSATTMTNYMVYCSTAPTVDSYHINLSGGTGLSVQLAKLIIIQDAGTSDVTATESQIEIGNNETAKNNTSAAPLNYPKYWYYDSSNSDGTKTFYAQASYVTSNASGSVTAVLQKDNAGDLATWSDVVTIVNAQTQTVPTLSSRVSFTPVSGCNYRITSYISSGSYTYSIYNAKIIIDQAGGSTLSGSIANISAILYSIDCTTAGESSNIFGVQETAQRGIFIKSDGTRGYFLTNTTQTLYQADFGTAWDMSTATYNSVAYAISGLTSVYSPFFKPDGTKLYIIDDKSATQEIYQYTVGTAWDLSGTVSLDKSQSVTGMGGSLASELAMKDMYITDDGTKLYMVGSNNNLVYAFSFGTAWDVATLSYVGSYSPGITPGGIWFAPNGMKMYVASTSTVYQYTLTTAWTITSGVSSDGISGSLGDTNNSGIYFSPNMSKMYAAGAQDDRWNEFNSGVSYTSSVVTRMESQYLLQNTYKNSVGLQNYDTIWEVGDWQGLANSYYHEINLSSDTADSAKLQYDPNGTPTDVTSSTATGTAYRSRSSAMTMPTTTQLLDTYISNVPIYASRIVVVLQVPSVPTLTSPTATNIAIPTATLGATISSDGGLSITARGTVWGTSPSPTGNALAEGGTSTGSFSHSRSSLPLGTIIYYRGYATNSKGTGYSADGILIPGPTITDQVQYDSDHETKIATGGSTTNTSVFLDFSTIAHNSSDTITPKVEVRSIGSSFTGTATHTGDAFSANPAVPRFRTYPAVIYDSANHRMILFGGKNDDNVYLNDVWELKLPNSEIDKPIWRQLSPSGTPPSARNAMVHVYDSTYQRLIIFGGFDGSSLGGFYSLTLPSDGDGAWSTFTPGGSLPSNRYTSDGIFDSLNQRLIIFGGYSTVDNNDAWKISLPSSLSSSASVLLAPTGTKPAVRSEHSMIYDSANQRIVLFAGWGSSRTNDVWQLTIPSDSNDGAWSQPSISGTAPSGRSGHDTIYDPVNQRMITVMGWNGTTYYNDIYELTLPNSGSFVWTNRTTADGTLPPKRRSHTAVYDSTNDAMVIFGGTDGLFMSNQPVYIDLTQSGSLYYTELAPNVNLMAGDGSSSVYDSDNHQMIRWGGYGRIYDTADPEGTGYHFNETWTYGLDNSNANYNNWSNITPGIAPLGREVSSVVYDSANKRLVIFGGLGYNQDEPFSDTWVMSMDSTSANYKKWVRLLPSGTPPSKRWGASAIYDPVNQRMIVFGGRLIGEGTTHYYDVYTLSLSSGSEAWSQPSLSGTGPTQGLFQSTAIYEPTYTRMLIFAGQQGAGSFSNKLWELRWDNGGTPSNMVWTERTPTYSPAFAARRGHIADYDSLYDRMVVIGGWDGTNHYNDVWSFDVSALSVTATQITASGTAPVVRRSHNGIYDPINQRMIIEGGRGALSPVNFLSDFWELTLPSGTSGWTWTQLNPLSYLKASVSVPSLTNNTGYHWQAWSTGSVSGDTIKVAYGGNAESASDFIIGTLVGGSTGVKFWNGSDWVYKPLKVWNGSQWVEKPIKVWSGSDWVTKG